MEDTAAFNALKPALELLDDQSRTIRNAKKNIEIIESKLIDIVRQSMEPISCIRQSKQTLQKAYKKTQEGKDAIETAKLNTREIRTMIEDMLAELAPVKTHDRYNTVSRTDEGHATDRSETHTNTTVRHSGDNTQQSTSSYYKAGTHMHITPRKMGSAHTLFWVKELKFCLAFANTHIAKSYRIQITRILTNMFPGCKFVESTNNADITFFTTTPNKQAGCIDGITAESMYSILSPIYIIIIEPAPMPNVPLEQMKETMKLLKIRPVGYTRLLQHHKYKTIVSFDDIHELVDINIDSADDMRCTITNYLSEYHKRS